MLERQRVGIERAKTEGKFRGKRSVKAARLAATIKTRHQAGEPLARIAADQSEPVLQRAQWRGFYRCLSWSL